VANFVAISQTVAAIWRIFDFLKWRPLPSWFLKLWIFKCRSGQEGQVMRVKLRHCAKFCGDRSNRCWYMAIFNFSKMAVVCHLKRCACLGHPRREFDGLYHCAKFGWNWYSTFDNKQVLIFCDLGLKMPIHAPKSGFLGQNRESGGVMSTWRTRS